MSPVADSTWSDEGTAGESSHMRGLTMRKRTDTPGLMNPEQEPDHTELQTELRLDEVELGIDKNFREVDEQGVLLVMSRPKPRGLLPIPGEVQAIIDKEEARLLNENSIVPTPEARQRMVDSFTLQYYYEGFYVAYRPTSQGPEVLAVGYEEIGRLLSGMDQEERLKIKVGQP
jgi:hypothetical protein